MQAAVRVGRIELDLDKHPDQVGLVTDLDARLPEHLLQGKIVLFASTEEFDRGLLLRLTQIHLHHNLSGHGDFVLGDAAIRLAEPSHDGKGRGEKGGLDLLLPAAPAGPRGGPGIVLQTPVEIMADRSPQQGPQGPAQHEAERAAEDLSPPVHHRKPQPQDSIFLIEGAYYIGIMRAFDYSVKNPRVGGQRRRRRP